MTTDAAVDEPMRAARRCVALRGVLKLPLSIRKASLGFTRCDKVLSTLPFRVLVYSDLQDYMEPTLHKASEDIVKDII